MSINFTKRNILKKKTRRSYNGKHRALYDYETLMPFCEFQLDTKYLLDKSTLPMEVYKHMKDYNLSFYEWNLMDLGTRTKFTAYSYELSSVFGLMFIVFADISKYSKKKLVYNEDDLCYAIGVVSEILGVVLKSYYPKKRQDGRIDALIVVIE